MYAKLRLPPHIRSLSRCSFRQTAILTEPNDRIEPNYFLYRDVIFLAEKKSSFLGSPECVWLLWASLEQKNNEQIDFLRKKGRKRESRVRRRFTGISSETAAPCYHVITDFPFYGFFNRRSPRRPLLESSLVAPPSFPIT